MAPAGAAHHWRSGAAALLAVLCTGPAAYAQQQDQQEDPTLIYDEDGLALRWHLQAGVNAVAESNLFWNLSDSTAPASGFDPDTEWLEGYIKPGLSFENTFEGGTVAYGKVSAVASYTAGTDAYDFADVGRVTLEEGYLGMRSADAMPVGVDFSLGPRELKLGTGMLIANGGSSGFERGALKFGPRKAWEMAAIGRVVGHGVTGTAFYIAPNELPSNDGDNRLAGLDLRYDNPAGDYLGLTFLNVLDSESPYVQAAPGGTGAATILPGARNGTNALNAYGKANPFGGALENFFVAGDIAYEWNDAVDLQAWAGRVQVGYTFADRPWSPTLTYSYQTFSGDDPDTPRLERFDPLYYEGSPSAWATGSKSSMVFINSNVQAHGLALSVRPTQRDTLTFRYAHIRANELRSPIQFGQATRFDTTGGTANLLAGVSNAHLADDFFLEYNRVINRNTFLTAGVSVSIPGAGIRSLFPGDDPIWSGGFVNVVVNF